MSPLRRPKRSASIKASQKSLYSTQQNSTEKTGKRSSKRKHTTQAPESYSFETGEYPVAPKKRSRRSVPDEVAQQEKENQPQRRKADEQPHPRPRLATWLQGVTGALSRDRRSKIHSPEGTTLLWFADFFFSSRTRDAFFAQIIADLRVETNEAYGQGRKAKAWVVRLRAYYHFAATVVRVSPIGKIVDLLIKMIRPGPQTPSDRDPPRSGGPH